MMNLIGNIPDVDSILIDLLKSNKVDLVSALDEIENNHFVFNVNDKTLDKQVDLNYTAPFHVDNEYEELKSKLDELKDVLKVHHTNNTKDIKLNLNKDSIKEETNKIYEEIHVITEQKRLVEEKLKELEDFLNSFPAYNAFSQPIEDLRNLNYFDYKFGILSKDDRVKLKKNYENILAVVLHTGTSKDGEVYLVLFPSVSSEEIGRILRSLNFKEIIIPDKYNGTPIEIKEQLEKEKSNLELEIKSYERELENLKNIYEDNIVSLLNQINIYVKIEKAKEWLGVSRRFFYLSGWISKKDKAEIENILSNYKDILVMFREGNDITPPTKLKNNWIFKPFETLVKMYGMPAYNEMDPTPFLSLSYMFLFGAMFGDLGQGFVILLAGILYSRKNKLFGGLLSRLGFSSMIFGVLYGAVFGFETIIPALLIRPFESINTVLVAAIVVGIILILIAYIYSMINCAKRKDIEEGLFGKEGLAGLLFYLSLLALVGGSLLGKPIISAEIAAILITICVLALVFKQPLTHLITNKRPLHGNDISGYYVESVFSLLETLLSMLSGTVSFIRVGAFALTHVGLFVAFETIGHMIGSAAGNIIVLFIGNILILGLEGLIVFIQGLRLQYYEMFSRYYKGDGKEFKPISIEE
jgi:V/A-type H+-transporting ATPase subunit I